MASIRKPNSKTQRTSPASIRYGDWVLEPDTLRLQTPTGSTRLSPKAVTVLEYLIELAPAPVSIQALLDRCWGPELVINDNVVHRVIADLRKALGDSSTAPNYIETVPRRGYRFIGEQIVDDEQRSAAIDIHTSIRLGFSNPNLLTATGVLFIISALVWFVPLSNKNEQSSTPSIRPSTIEKPVLLVTLLDDHSDQQQHRLASILTEELSLRLSRIKGIDTLSQNATRYLSGNSTRLTEVIQLTGATHLLEGSYRLDHDQIRVVLRLLDTDTSREIVTVEDVRNFSDLINQQISLARDLVDALSTQFAGLSYGDVASYDSTKPEAVSAFLLAQQLVLQDNSADLKQAMSYLNTAIEYDPSFSRAWGQLARATYQLGIRSGRPSQIETQLAALLTRANEVRDTPEVSRAVERMIFVQQGRWADSEKNLHQSLVVAPTATGFNLYGYYLANAGLVDLGMKYYQRAFEMDPFDPNTVDFIGALTLSQGNAEAALPYFDRCLKIAPQHAGCATSRAKAAVLAGNTSVLARWPTDEHPVFGRILLCLAARECTVPSEFVDIGREDQTNLAYLFALAGDLNQAFTALERSRQLPYSAARQIRWQNPVPELARDPRYQLLLQQLKIDDDWQAELCRRAGLLTAATGIVADC